MEASELAADMTSMTEGVAPFQDVIKDASPRSPKPQLVQTSIQSIDQVSILDRRTHGVGEKRSGQQQGNEVGKEEDN
ncbi:hypothetical protein VdG2_05788 [Verticillium dahliae VDG2]|nr:hypothetical protein VdG2_05788 [Verticillium dahliae VDG2]